MAKADWINLQRRARVSFAMVDSQQVYPLGTVGLVHLRILAGAAATTVTVREGGPGGDIIHGGGGQPGNPIEIPNVLFRNGLHVTVSESDAIILGVGTPGFDTSLVVTSLTLASPTPRGGAVPEGASFDDSGVTQDVDSGVVLDPSVEYISFDDVTAWNGLTAFTVVYRYLPFTLSGDLILHSRWSTSPSDERQFLFRQQNGSELNALISQGGDDYAALRSPGFTVQGNDWMYGFGFDGSLGGTNGLDRLRPLRKRGVGNAWEDVGWGGGTFFNLRSDVPTALHTMTGVNELIPRRADGTGTGADGELRLMLVKYGEKYTPAELEAMNLYTEPVNEADWDRIYYFDGNLVDEGAGEVYGVFV